MDHGWHFPGTPAPTRRPGLRPLQRPHPDTLISLFPSRWTPGFAGGHEIHQHVSLTRPLVLEALGC